MFSTRNSDMRRRELKRDETDCQPPRLHRDCLVRKFNRRLLRNPAFGRRCNRGGAVASTLARVVADAAGPTINLMPALLEAVRARATVGEVVDALEGVFGTYVERAVV